MRTKLFAVVAVLAVMGVWVGRADACGRRCGGCGWGRSCWSSCASYSCAAPCYASNGCDDGGAVYYGGSGGYSSGGGYGYGRGYGYGGYGAGVFVGGRGSRGGARSFGSFRRGGGGGRRR